MARKTKPLEERFWAKVDKTGACWLWTGCLNNMGYGKIKVDGKDRYAHRVSAALTYGPIPDGMTVDHKCHTPACVNPTHLRIATYKQNAENRSGAMKNSATGIRGVWWDKRKKRWFARVNHRGKIIHAGMFTNIADAEAAVIAKRRELFTHSDMDAA